MLFPFFVSVREAPPRHVASKPTKKPQPETRFPERFLRAAALPVGPSLDPRRLHVPAPLVPLLQVACQLGGAEKTVWNQSIKLICWILWQAGLLSFAASRQKTCRFIVQCEKIGSR
jgi:hypothetical protein